MLRPDHVPTMEGDGNDATPATRRSAACSPIGYLKGLREAAYADPDRSSG